MTDADMARAIRIAAHGLATGRDAVEVERTLADYMPALSPAELTDILFHGRTAVRAGELASQGNPALAEALLAGIRSASPGAAYAVVQYQIGPNADHDWKSTVVQQRQGESIEDMMARARQEVGQLTSGGEGGKYPVMQGWTTQQAVTSTRLEFLATTGLQPLP